VQAAGGNRRGATTTEGTHLIGYKEESKQANAFVEVKTTPEKWGGGGTEGKTTKREKVAGDRGKSERDPMPSNRCQKSGEDLDTYEVSKKHLTPPPKG